MLRINAHHLRQLLATLPQIKDPQYPQLNSNLPISGDSKTGTQYGHFLWTSSLLLLPDARFERNNSLNPYTTLVSETLLANEYSTSGGCFTFYYMMTNANPGSIDLFIKRRGGDLTTKQPLLLQHFTQGTGPYWHQATVNLGPGMLQQNNVTDFELLFRVSLGDTPGHLALDSFTMYPGEQCQAVADRKHEYTFFDCGDKQDFVQWNKVCNWVGKLGQRAFAR
jgi:hypothetical protein